MIDMHSHILPNIDDGAKSNEETFNLIKEAKEAGFTGIISTSHCYIGYYEADVSERKALLEKLATNLNGELSGVELYIGSEIYVTSNMPELIKENKASSLNNTRYVLFELPFESKIQNLKDIIFDLIGNNYVPIIAHPERYKYVQENPNMLIEFIELGVLFQSNYGSIIGQYGNEAKKTVKLLLKNNLVHFLGSDVHRQKTVYKKMPEILLELEKIISKDEIQELTTINPKLVLSNEEIEIRTPKEIKQGFFSRIFK